MAAAVSEQDIYKAVAEAIARRDVTINLHSMAGTQISWRSIFAFEIVRSMESRRQDPQTHPGKIDLSKRPVYESLKDHQLPSPQDPSVRQQRKLVLRDSIREQSCECGDGRVPCSHCEGRGKTPCDPTVTCPTCAGNGSCVACEDTGRRRAGRSAAAKGGETDERVTCVKCGAANAACPLCQGRGVTWCDDCNGDGSVTCEKCKGGKSVKCPTCKGSAHLTTWTEGIIEHNPEKERAGSQEKRPPLLVRLRIRFSRQWPKAMPVQEDSLPENLEESHRTEVASRLPLRKGEVGRKMTIRYLPLARVVVGRVPNRVYYAFPEEAGIKVIPLPSQRRVAQITVTALVVAAIVLVAVLLSR